MSASLPSSLSRETKKISHSVKTLFETGLPKQKPLHIRPTCPARAGLLPDSSAVEHSTVNRMAVGSNPTQGATFSKIYATATPRLLRQDGPPSRASIRLRSRATCLKSSQRNIHAHQLRTKKKRARPGPHALSRLGVENISARRTGAPSARPPNAVALRPANSRARSTGHCARGSYGRPPSHYRGWQSR